MKKPTVLIELAQRYYHTLKHLKWIQIKYQLLYRIFKPIYSIRTNSLRDIEGKLINQLSLLQSIESTTTFIGQNTFDFLNDKYKFDQKIDWNHNSFGKLWTYNLNYFEYLSQPNLSKEKGIYLIHDFIANENKIKDGMESYPISLRAIFWIKFLIRHQINDRNINQSLYRQLHRLSIRPEYHLMGNHLLENGFGLLFGGCYFNDKRLIKLANKILTAQLKEQILADGAHFELSPMYHQIMLYRILDCINLLEQNPNVALNNLLVLLNEKAALMLGWIDEIMFSNGTLPMVNDSTYGIAPEVNKLKEYANRLDINPHKVSLKECGYRKVSNGKFELLIDIGHIGPDYIPGHAHSDTFNFILHCNGRPIIIDTGISTYEKNQRRNLERSTYAHNTVVVSEKEQSEVWGGFRVAQRANISNLIESNDAITASHDGYQKINAVHKRTFKYEKNDVIIIDEVTKNHAATAYLHFHPNAKITIVDHQIHGNFGRIIFNNLITLRLEPFQMAIGFNKTVNAQRAVISFKENLQTKIVDK